MAEKIFEIECGPDNELVFRFRRPKSPFLTVSAREQVRNSAKEILLGIRSLIDATIQMVETKEEGGDKGRTNIEVN